MWSFLLLNKENFGKYGKGPQNMLYTESLKKKKDKIIEEKNKI